MPEPNHPWHKLGRHIRRKFVAGLIIVVPVAATVLIFKLIFDFLDPPLRDGLEWIVKQTFPGLDFLENLQDMSFPGLGIILLLIVIYLAGLVGTHFIGRRLVALGGKMINQIPLVGIIYRTAHQATQLFTRAAEDGRGRVVLLDFPRAGTKSIGLVTARVVGKNGEPMSAVYVPTTPNPTSGYLVIVPDEQLIPTDIPVDEAMKIVISGGFLSSDELSPYASREPVPPDKHASNH